MRAVEQLRMSDGLDEEETIELREPFMFLFSLQADHDSFSEEIMDARQMRVFASFERWE